MLLKKVLARIKPRQSEIDSIHKFLGRLEDETRALGYNGVAVGSVGKHTWIRGDHDIDWFVFFEKGISREELEKTGLSIGKKLAKKLRANVRIKYAEHPYVRMLLGKYMIDVVPCYRIEKGDRIISAVDRSPLHAEFINSELPARAQDDVRLLKQFMKGARVYGSDLRHCGFSGYIAELLIIKHASFGEAVKAASKWKPGTVIGFGKSAVRKFLKAPLVIIDPVDESRNVAASLNEENFIRFMSACNEFLKKPSMDFFFPKDMPLSSSDIRRIQERGTYWFAFVAKAPDVIDDILWPQMRRASERIAGILRRSDFEVYTNGVFASKSMVMFFELEEGTKPPAERMEGPPVYAQKNAEQFLGKYSSAKFGIRIEGGRIIAFRERPMRRASEIKSICKSTPAEIRKAGIPDNIANALKRSRFLEQKSFWSYVKKDRELSEYMKRKMFCTISLSLQ